MLQKLFTTYVEVSVQSRRYQTPVQSIGRETGHRFADAHGFAPGQIAAFLRGLRDAGEVEDFTLVA